MQTIAVCNRKGGVGKTTVAVHLAATLGARGHRTLLIDLDAQATSTLVLTSQDQLRRALRGREPDMSNVLHREVVIGQVIRPSTAPGVDLAPATDALTSAWVHLGDRTGRDTLVRRALRDLPRAPYDPRVPYEYVVIDTPPESSLATGNALVAAHWVLIPFTADPSALHGLAFVEKQVDDVRSSLNESLVILGAIQVAYDRRLSITEVSREEMREAAQDLLLETRIRSNAKFLSCAGQGQTVLQLEAEQGGGERRGTADFIALADELVARIAKGAWQ